MMNGILAAEMLAEWQKWRRGKPPYDGDTPETYNKMPYSPKEIGIALDYAIEVLKEYDNTGVQSERDHT